MLLAALAIFSLAACGWRARAAPTGHTAPIHVIATPIPLDPSDPNDVVVGDFHFAGGLVLTSPDTTRLGGLSDLKISPGGDLISESDEGDLLRAHLRLDAAGRPVALDDATLGSLLGLDGRPLQGKAEADSEGVAVWPNGDLMVSFERDHRIWLYPATGGPAHAIPKPDIAMPDNEGMEGLTLAPTHGADAYWVGVEGGSIWLCHLSGGCSRWTALMSPPFGYRLTSLAETASGDLVILHHSFNPLTFQSRIQVSIVSVPAAPDGKSKLKAQFKLGPPMTVDNFEGVTTGKAPGGGLRLYLIVDDNFSTREQTLFYAFDELPGKADKRSARH